MRYAFGPLLQSPPSSPALPWQCLKLPCRGAGRLTAPHPIPTWTAGRGPRSKSARQDMPEGDAEHDAAQSPGNVLPLNAGIPVMDFPGAPRPWLHARLCVCV